MTPSADMYMIFKPCLVDQAEFKSTKEMLMDVFKLARAAKKKEQNIKLESELAQTDFYDKNINNDIQKNKLKVNQIHKKKTQEFDSSPHSPIEKRNKTIKKVKFKVLGESSPEASPELTDIGEEESLKSGDELNNL